MIKKLIIVGNDIELLEYEKKPRKTRKSLFLPRERYNNLPFYKKRRFDSLVRSKKTCLRRVSIALAEIGVPLFVTLTFDGSASDVSYASDCVSKLQRRLRVAFVDCQSVFIPELSPRGRLHFHGLVFGVPLHYGDVRRGRRVISYGLERSERLFAKCWGVGYVDVVQTDGAGRLAGYMTKYITSSFGNDLLNGIRLLRFSRGFPRPIVVDNDDYIKDFLSRDYESDYTFEGSNMFLGKITKKYFVNVAKTIG